MKTKFSLASVALAGGILLAGLCADSASACAFAKGKNIFGLNDTVKIDFNKLALGAAAGVGALTIAGIVSYRARLADQPNTGEEITIPEAFSIPVPPSALTPVAVEEEVETSNLR
jgi:hypothetical protein